MGDIDGMARRREQIRQALREAPLAALREMLPDSEILRACAEAGHRYRSRLYDPVVTVFHVLLQAIQREESFAATWQEVWSLVAGELGMAGRSFNSSALSQARSRLPKAVLDKLVRAACDFDEECFSRWRGMRLLALDGTTVSMPRERALFDRFGAHKARTTTVRYPLGTFCSLLAVGSSLVVDHRFGPFDPGESATATPLLDNIGRGDLLLADRGFAGSPTFARVYARGADFLMRKNARLIASRLPVIRRLGRDDFITEIAMCKPARKLDPSLPEKVRFRIFRASWKAPFGKKVTDWFVTSLPDPRRFKKRTLAKLYHERWRIETSYEEFKVTFHADVLRSKTVPNVEKEMAAHVLAYQLVRRLVVAAAKKHRKKPAEISFLNAARWVLAFSSRMSVAAAWRLPAMYDRLLDAIASTEVDIRPGRIEPRALTREWKHYPHLRMTRAEWRERRLQEVA